MHRGGAKQLVGCIAGLTLRSDRRLGPHCTEFPREALPAGPPSSDSPLPTPKGCSLLSLLRGFIGADQVGKAGKARGATHAAGADLHNNAGGAAS